MLCISNRSPNHVNLFQPKPRLGIRLRVFDGGGAREVASQSLGYHLSMDFHVLKSGVGIFEAWQWPSPWSLEWMQNAGESRDPFWTTNHLLENSDRGSHVVERHGQGVYAEHVALVYTAKVGFENIHPVHKHVIFGGYETNESLCLSCIRIYMLNRS